MTALCPHCANDDPSLLEALVTDRYGNIVYGCKICTKLFTITKDGVILKAQPPKV